MHKTFGAVPYCHFAIAIAFCTGIAGDLAVQPLSAHSRSAGIPTAAAAVAAAILPVARFVGALVLAQLDRPFIPLLFVALSVLGYVVLLLLRQSGAALIVAFCCIGLGEQLATVQVIVSHSLLYILCKLSPRQVPPTGVAFGSRRSTLTGNLRAYGGVIQLAKDIVPVVASGYFKRRVGK